MSNYVHLNVCCLYFGDPVKNKAGDGRTAFGRDNRTVTLPETQSSFGHNKLSESCVIWASEETTTQQKYINLSNNKVRYIPEK